MATFSHHGNASGLEKGGAETTEHGGAVGMGMAMYFTYDRPTNILFKPWSPKTDGEMVGAVFAVFFMAVSFEALKRGRQMLYAMEALRSAVVVDSDPPAGAVPSSRIIAALRRMFRPFHLLQTILQGVQFVLGYFLMLAAMTFNVWLFLGMIFGTMFGYFVFHWNPANSGYASLSSDHCH